MAQLDAQDVWELGQVDFNPVCVAFKRVNACSCVSACHVLPQPEGSLQVGQPSTAKTWIFPRIPEITSVIGWAKLPEQGDLSTQTAKEQTDVDKCSALGTTVLSWSLWVSKYSRIQGSSSLHKGSPWILPPPSCMEAEKFTSPKLSLYARLKWQYKNTCCVFWYT